MADHLKLLLLLVNLFIGAGILFFIYTRLQKYGSKYLLPVFRYTLIINIFLFIIFFTMYADINLPQIDYLDESSGKVPLTFALVYTAIPLLLVTMLEISGRLMNRKLKKTYIRVLLLACLFVGIATYIISYTFIVNPDLRRFLVFFENFGALLILVEVFLLIRLYLFSVKNSFNEKVIKSFSLLHLIRYPLLLTVFTIPNPLRSFLAILFINITPYIWIRFFVDNTESTEIPENGVSRIEHIGKQKGLSKRELEIMLLIVQGKTNREIQEQLFVSYHTVKNHVYNIFQKMEVNSRYQLISLVNINEKNL